jgi:hypothetical protein
MLRLSARTSHWVAAALIASVSACLQPAEPDPPVPILDGGADDVAPQNVSPGVVCSTGTGRLRVSVSLDPSLVGRTSDVWLAVQCNNGTGPVRIVRWDGSATQTLDGFGPGTYRVFGSSFLAPGQWSNTATLSGVATAAVSLTLGSEGALLASVNETTPPSDGGGAPGEWTMRVPVREMNGAPMLGQATVVARAIGADLEVRVVVQNQCGASVCAPLMLHSVEARALEGTVPTGFAWANFASPMVLQGALSASAAMRLRAMLPNAAHALQVAVYGVRSASPQRMAGPRP